MSKEIKKDAQKQKANVCSDEEDDQLLFGKHSQPLFLQDSRPEQGASFLCTLEITHFLW